jgi:GntR family transcriptional repressor for pyruvate dehydrogenase complex
VAKPRPITAQLSTIQVPKPADLILREIRNLISNGSLKAGDRLPPERELAERFGIGRGHVREALRKLESFGVLQTFPQSGTVVATLGVAALERLISNLLDLDRDDVKALVETRVILEIQIAKLAAERATAASIADLSAAHDAFRREVCAGRTGVEEDLMFHLAVAHAAQNHIMVSLVGLIAPDIIRVSKGSRVCEAGRASAALAEHEKVFAAIAARDAKAAVQAMSEHMQMTQAQFADVVVQGRHLRRGRKTA